MNRSYHLTGRQPDAQLTIEYEVKARSQEYEILSIFHRIKKPLSAGRMYLILNERYPLTSVRRAITNLKSFGFLVFLEDQVAGLYGRPEHLYALNNDQGKALVRMRENYPSGSSTINEIEKLLKE